MERFILLIAHYILISSTTSLRGINLESFARSFSLTSVTQRGLGSPASTSPCHSPPTRHVVLDHHHESHPILPGLKLLLDRNVSSLSARVLGNAWAFSRP